MDYDVIVIGGGAAGLACAESLLRGNKNLKICVAEAGDRLGKKLAVTGNGQGNISNLNMTAEHFHGGNVPLVEKIACADPFAGTKLFNCLFAPDDKGRIYPAGKQASALTDSFIKNLNGKVDIKLASVVAKIEKGFTLSLLNGGKLSSRFVVVCAGGFAQPIFKLSSPYDLVAKLGHCTTALYPSLVQLKMDTTHIKTLKGIRADCVVTAVVDGKPVKTARGDVIFTEYGVSGNAIFSVSSYIADKQNVTLSLEFLPDISADDIKKDILNKKSLGYEASELLSGTVHNQIGRTVIKRAGSSDENAIVKTLKNFTLKVTGALGFGYAQVTKGGIKMNEITDELESKLVKNLFFAGEILDVDGDCGGYNLQWAFTSGMTVADAILKRV